MNNINIKKDCHFEFISRSMYMQSIPYKKAAMFGLDARIALAIFGALSLITGVALYSVIEKSEKVAFIATLNEISKATEAYLIDTRKDVLINPGSGVVERKTYELLSSTQKNWNGPYIKGKKVDARTQDIIVKGMNVYLYAMTEYNLGNNSTSTGWYGEECVAGKNCYYWIRLHICTYNGWDSEDVLMLDKMIDGGDGIDKGNFRANWYLGDKKNPIVFYKVLPTLSQPLTS